MKGRPPGGVLPQPRHGVPVVQLPEAVQGVEEGTGVERYATGALAGLLGSVGVTRLGSLFAYTIRVQFRCLPSG